MTATARPMAAITATIGQARAGGGPGLADRGAGVRDSDMGVISSNTRARCGVVGVHRSGPHQSTLHRDGNTLTPVAVVVTFRTETT